MKLSVIIPAYNVAEYIGECIDSVKNQSYQDLEIIVVNDGSTDRTREIIRNFETDSRLIIIDKKNGGLSDARNAGIERASGDLITFIDGDDLISADTFEQSVHFFIEDSQLDMIQYPVLFNWMSDHQYLRKPSYHILLGNEVFLNWWKNNELIYSVCNKVFRKSVFESIRFPVGKSFEDMYIVPEMSKKIKKAIISEHGIYYYRFREGSILNSFLSYQKHSDQLDAMFKIYSESVNCINTKCIRAEFWIDIIWWQLYSLQNYTKKERNDAIAKIKVHQLNKVDFLNGNLSLKKRLRIFCLYCIGFSNLFSLFWHWKRLIS